MTGEGEQIEGGERHGEKASGRARDYVPAHSRGYDDTTPSTFSRGGAGRRGFSFGAVSPIEAMSSWARANGRRGDPSIRIRSGRRPSRAHSHRDRRRGDGSSRSRGRTLAERGPAGLRIDRRAAGSGRHGAAGNGGGLRGGGSAAGAAARPPGRTRRDRPSPGGALPARANLRRFFRLGTLRRDRRRGGRGRRDVVLRAARRFAAGPRRARARAGRARGRAVVGSQDTRGAHRRRRGRASELRQVDRAGRDRQTPGEAGIHRGPAGDGRGCAGGSASGARRSGQGFGSGERGGPGKRETRSARPGGRSGPADCRNRG